MLLLIHIPIALSSLIFTTYLFFYPSKNKLNISYVLSALTLITGSILLFSKPSHLASACIMGLIYFGAVSFGIVSARRKLSKLEIK